MFFHSARTQNQIFLSELNVYSDTAENLGKSQQRCVHCCCWAVQTECNQLSYAQTEISAEL